MAEIRAVRATTHKGFMDYPAEIQSAIITALYTSPKFPRFTAFLSTNKALYKAAYPVFLANYPLECMPVKPGHINASHGLGRGDILKIVYPHDDDRFNMHLFEPQWLDGIRTGMQGLFEIGDDGDSDSDDDDEASSTEEEVDDEWEEDSADYDSIDGFDLNDMESSVFERGQQFARYWIRKNPFAALLREIGIEKAARIGKLDIHWGECEANRLRQLLTPAPYAVGIMSIVCGLFLPALTQLTLQRTGLEGDFEIHGRSDDLFGSVRLSHHQYVGETEDEIWPESMRVAVMGPKDMEGEGDDGDQAYMIKAVKLLLAACEGLKVLELRDWKTRGHPRWWKELFEKPSLDVRVQWALEN